MEKKSQKLQSSSIYNNSSLNELKRNYFPSLTHKELLSIHDLKLKTNYGIKAKILHNFHRNFHSEVMKNNLKENSKFSTIYSTLYKDSASYTKTETKFPSLRKDKDENIVKLSMNPKIINSMVSKSVKKHIKINYKTIFNKNTSKKYNISNISTSDNASPSINSLKFSALDKLKSSSMDFNGSLHNFEKEENSLEQLIKIQKSNNTSSVSFQIPQKYLSTETPNNYINNLKKEFNKKFVSSLNPLYSRLKDELLSEFSKKTKDINYLKFILLQNKKDIEIEEERRISRMERINQILFNIEQNKTLFEKFFNSKNDYLNYLQKEISKETEKNEVLKEEKLNLTKEIYLIRHKTLRLENRFKNYLDDKFFLLSVKNHSFKLDKFDPEDIKDYKKDLQKLEVLNFMLKITSQEFYDSELEKEKLKENKLPRKSEIININNNKTFNRTNSIRPFHRQNTRTKKITNVNNTGYNPLFSVSKKNIMNRKFVAKPIYVDVYYFNKDLEETTQKIQDSLDEYNNIIKDLAIEQQNLIKAKKETTDIKDYEIHLKNEIILFKRNLENIKQKNIGLINYKNYLENIFILNLNKGKIVEKLDIIMNTIKKSGDKNLLNFISNETNDYHVNVNTSLYKLKFIERVFEYLTTFKMKQINEKNEDYFEIQREIDENNRKRLSQRKQEFIQGKFNLLINKVLSKNKKLIILPRKKVKENLLIYLKKNKTEKKENKDDDYFGNFDIV